MAPLLSCACFSIYAAAVPVIGYSIFGSGVVTAVGPTALDSIMTYSTMSSVLSGSQAADPATLVALARVLALVIGLLQVALGLAHFGSLANFLSHSVMTGFVTASALVISTGQIQVQRIPKFPTLPVGPPPPAHHLTVLYPLDTPPICCCSRTCWVCTVCPRTTACSATSTRSCTCCGTWATAAALPRRSASLAWLRCWCCKHGSEGATAR